MLNIMNRNIDDILDDIISELNKLILIIGESPMKQIIGKAIRRGDIELNEENQIVVKAYIIKSDNEATCKKIEL